MPNMHVQHKEHAFVGRVRERARTHTITGHRPLNTWDAGLERRATALKCILIGKRAHNARATP